MTHPTSAPRGITLIESIIYIALLGVLLVGVIVSAYPLFVGAERVTAKVAAENEATFVLRKVGWALASASAVSVPNGTTLTVQHVAAGSQSFTLNGTVIEQNGTPLTATRAPITNLRFANVAAAGGTPRYVELEFDAGSGHVGPTRWYLPHL